MCVKQEVMAPLLNSRWKDIRGIQPGNGRAPQPPWPHSRQQRHYGQRLRLIRGLTVQAWPPVWLLVGDEYCSTYSTTSLMQCWYVWGSQPNP